jgi:ATP-dependent Clp protease ATP-binding subunit ClpA
MCPRAVAELLFGDDKKMIRIDMSEHQDDAVSLDKLIGMPRGIASHRSFAFLEVA